MSLSWSNSVFHISDTCRHQFHHLRLLETLIEISKLVLKICEGYQKQEESKDIFACMDPFKEKYFLTFD